MPDARSRNDTRCIRRYMEEVDRKTRVENPENVGGEYVVGDSVWLPFPQPVHTGNCREVALHSAGS